MIKNEGSQALDRRQEFIIAHWHRHGEKAIGSSALLAIQRALRDAFGESAVESPAKIARVLADAGAELRHPQIIESDAKWREEAILQDAKKFKEFETLVERKRLGLKQAEQLIIKLEQARRDCKQTNDEITEQDLRDLAIGAKQAAQSIANDPGFDVSEREQQAEIVEWFSVWLQNPALFEHWLDLRQRSSKYRQKFSVDADEQTRGS